MTAFLKQMPLAKADDELLAFDDLGPPARADSSFPAAFFAAAFAFLCFMPYPAIGVGSNSAVQAGNIATVLALLCASVGLWQRLPLAIIALVLAPLCIATFKVAIIDDGNVALCLKTLVCWAVSLLTVAAVQLHAPRHALAMLTGIAIAILVHATVGAIQLHSFSAGVFPLVDLYVNPSFLSVQQYATQIARWTQRPFGLFPEPSAMSSCLAPFVIFFAALSFGIVRLRQTPALWQRWLFAIASASGLGLIIVSRSGHAAPTMAAVVLLVLIWSLSARATFKTYFGLTLLLGLILPLVLLFAYNAMSARLAGGTEMGNDSWEERTASLWLGFQAWSQQGIAAGIFGLGPGTSSQAVQDASGISAVFSILLSYLYDTGIVGLIATAWVVERLTRVWKVSRLSPVFAAIAIVWIIGVTLTTSYEQLLPLWIGLAWLASWNEICEPAALKRLVRDVAPRITRATPIKRMSPWTVPSLVTTDIEESIAP
jgi:hypothetical protein